MPRPHPALFRACSLLALCAAAFHVASLASPAIARLEYDATYPVWRHLLFIAIDATAAWLFLRRPPWFVWAYALLTLQTLNSHARGAWALWTNHHQLDWISIAVSVAAPMMLILLILDQRALSHTTRST